MNAIKRACNFLECCQVLPVVISSLPRSCVQEWLICQSPRHARWAIGRYSYSPFRTRLCLPLKVNFIFDLAKIVSFTTWHIWFYFMLTLYLNTKHNSFKRIKRGNLHIYNSVRIQIWVNTSYMFQLKGW